MARSSFVSEGDAWSASYDGKEVKRLTTGGGVANLRAASDGKTAFFYRNGGLFKMTVGNNNPVTPVTFSATSERDLRAERRAAFNEFWRQYNTRFYDGNFHGRDWTAIRALRAAARFRRHPHGVRRPAQCDGRRVGSLAH
jgi:hypothetical protein